MLQSEHFKAFKQALNNLFSNCQKRLPIVLKFLKLDMKSIEFTQAALKATNFFNSF